MAIKLKETCKDTLQREDYFAKVEESFLCVARLWSRVRQTGKATKPETKDRVMDRHSGLLLKN